MAITQQDAKVAELKSILSSGDDLVAHIVGLWDKYDNQRAGKKAEWLELRNYIFATDTSTTSNNSLPWKNSTTLPKLCQIRDNLHSNYLSALFPNDDWLRWEGYSSQDATKSKAKTIESYMSNKVREGNFRNLMSQLLYDYIDYGMSFATSDFESNVKELADGTKIPGFIGPRGKRISPLDIVFNPLAGSFDKTWKIVRSVVTEGDLLKMSESAPDYPFLQDALQKRNEIINKIGGFSKEDFEKSEAYVVDGFGNLQEYYQSGYVEILEFYGDYRNPETGKLELNKVLTVMDRQHLIRQADIPSWMGTSPLKAVGWRYRPDNLWAMGPLDNLVGLQYRIDHLENLKADAMDLTVHPPLKIIGEVEEFAWEPRAEIHIDENGDVQELGKNLNGIMVANNDIAALEARMELYAGAPREAMGVRTPGEKTAFEVQTLENAAGRIFQEKITSFEINLLEPLLNDMLEQSRRNMETSDIIRTLDDDLAVQEFLTITREDITAAGTLRPIGARHFASQANLLQNLTNVMNSSLGAKLEPHISSIAVTKMIEDVLGLPRFQIFKPNVAVFEQMETQRIAQEAQSALQEEALTSEQEDF